jgi:hypothetical protein
VELELLLQRLFELEETDEDGVVILSDEDQLHRMLFSLRVLYAQVADQPRPPGGPLMTDQDVNVLTNIVFELGAAREHASRTRRSFFLTSGAYSRMMEVLEQLAPGQRGAQARAVAQQNLQDRLNREEQQRLQREAEERRRREAEERRRREAEEEERRQAAERRRREAEEEERRVRPRIVDDDDDDEPFNVHPAAVVGWNDFVDAVGKNRLGVLSASWRTAVPNPSPARAIAREVADAQLRNEGGVPDERFAEVLATRLIEERVLESFYRDDAFLSIRLRSELLRLAWDYVGSAVRRDLDFAAADFVLHAAADRGEITPDENSPFDDEDNSESRLIRWLLMGGRGFHRDSQFFSVAQGLAAAATNYAANDAAFKESREEQAAAAARWGPSRQLFPHSNATLAFGREVLARRYLGELQSARRELEARRNAPVRSDGAGPSGVHDGSAAAADDNDDDDEEEEPVRRRWNYGGYLRGLDGAPPAASDDNACEQPELEYDSEDEEMFWNCIQAERM